jgi:hypothetical protein
MPSVPRRNNVSQATVMERISDTTEMTTGIIAIA